MLICLGLRDRDVPTCEFSGTGQCDEERRRAADRDRDHRERVRWMRDQADLLAARVHREREGH